MAGTRLVRQFDTTVAAAGFAFNKSTSKNTTKTQSFIVTYRVVSGQLTPAQIRLATTNLGLGDTTNGIILIPAAPARSINRFSWGTVALDFATTAHTAATGTLGFQTNVAAGGSALAVSGTVTNAIFTAASADQIVDLPALQAVSTAGSTYAVLNTINLRASVAPTGTGDSPINWVVGYYTITKIVD